MTSINQWDGGAPPRFHLIRTADSVVCQFHTDVPDGLARQLEHLCHEERGPPGTWPVHHGRYLDLLSADRPVTSVAAGLVYAFTDDVVPRASATSIDESNAYLLRGGLDDWLPDVPHRRPFVAMVEDDYAVSVCASVRMSSAMHVAGVETQADYQRRGHAANAVACWARAVRSLGATPVYSAAWDNIASLGVARRFGMSLLGADLAIT